MDEKQRAEHDSKVLWNQYIVYAIVAELPLMQSRGKKLHFYMAGEHLSIIKLSKRKLSQFQLLIIFKKNNNNQHHAMWSNSKLHKYRMNKSL